MPWLDELSDLDFEDVVADLLRAETKLNFTAGTRGADKNVDVAATDEHGALHVAQCKHYRTSGLSKLRTAARSEAAAWRGRPKPASYRFVTSRRLNHENREELASALSALVSSVDDIYGETQLRQLLKDHPEVEARHVKLWLAGAGQLHRLLHAGTYEHSAALLTDIESRVPTYVETDRFRAARSLLARERLCVVAGPAGVGKTTLAKLLLLDALAEGFQPFEIPQHSIAQAWNLAAVGGKQVFYYDDFLGRIGPFGIGDDHELLFRFMRRAIANPDMRFILTTREYILRRVREVSEVLDREIEQVERVILDLENYSRHERARILYNHVYFAPDIDAVARRALLNNRAYLRIIDHHNYSPRLVEWMTGLAGHRLTDGDRRRFDEYCLEVLDDPRLMWSHAYRQLDVGEQLLLLSLLSLPEPAEEPELEAAFLALCHASGVPATAGRFTRALHVLDDSFVSTRLSGNVLTVRSLNPSLLDFLAQILRASEADARSTVEGALYFDQVLWLWDALTVDSSGQSRRLSSAVVASFARALARTFDTPVPDRRFDVFYGKDSGLIRRLKHAEGRLEVTLDLLSTHPVLLPELAPFLSSRGQALIESVEKADGYLTYVFPLIKRLAEVGALDPRACAATIKSKVFERPRHLMWEFIAPLLDLYPGALSDEERLQARCDLSKYLEEVRHEPTAFLSDPGEADDLYEASRALEVEPEGDWYDDVHSELEEFQGDDAEPEYDRDYDRDSAGWSREVSDADTTIDTMFERFTDE